MILAGCIFSQSATGEVSSAYFRKLAISRGGECKFSQTGPQRRRGGGGGRHEEEEEEEEEEPEFDSSGDEIPYVKRGRRR